MGMKQLVCCLAADQTKIPNRETQNGVQEVATKKDQPETQNRTFFHLCNKSHTQNPTSRQQSDNRPPNQTHTKINQTNQPQKHKKPTPSSQSSKTINQPNQDQNPKQPPENRLQTITFTPKEKQTSWLKTCAIAIARDASNISLIHEELIKQGMDNISVSPLGGNAVLMITKTEIELSHLLEALKSWDKELMVRNEFPVDAFLLF